VRRSSKSLPEVDSAEAEGSSGRSSARLVAALEADGQNNLHEIIGADAAAVTAEAWPD